MPKETYILRFSIIIFFLSTGCMQKSKKTINETFNSQKWLNGDHILRGSMVNSLINDSLLMDKSKSEIISLLGKQDDSTDFGNTYIWNVDQELMGNDTWRFWLKVDFDSTNEKSINVWATD